MSRIIIGLCEHVWFIAIRAIYSLYLSYWKLWNYSYTVFLQTKFVLSFTFIECYNMHFFYCFKSYCKCIRTTQNELFNFRHFYTSFTYIKHSSHQIIIKEILSSLSILSNWVMHFKNLKCGNFINNSSSYCSYFHRYNLHAYFTTLKHILSIQHRLSSRNSHC